jgi:hypothetical protein
MICLVEGPDRPRRKALAERRLPERVRRSWSKPAGGVVGHAGARLLADVAEPTGLTEAWRHSGRAAAAAWCARPWAGLVDLAAGQLCTQTRRPQGTRPTAETIITIVPATKPTQVKRTSRT